MTKTLSSFRNQRNDLDKRQDIAVVGLACRFPKSESVEEFWNSLCEGRFCVTDLSSRQARFRFFQSLPRQGGFLSEIDLFDPDFFSIPSQEAIEIDPLTRQVLLLIPKLFSNASYTLGEIKGKTIGIFIGSRSGTYSEKIAPFHKNSVVGLGQNFIAAYASQVFDLRGPSLVVDAACASSLLSVHLACQSLKSGECDLAIAGGVDLLLDDKPFDLLQAAGALSTRGKCAFFDSEADGIAIGEGVGLVLLKRYADALIDHNGISAVIEGSATNNDGRTMGVTTPNPYQQEHVIRSAIKNAAIDPRSICYIEAHGTGTMIGDPLELQALSRVFSREMMGTKKIGVGSVKANLGHLLSAAGIASLIKVILSLQYKKIPASIHCIQKNPRFVFADSAFDLVQTLIPLEERKEDYRAGVSAFGFGGTNVHLILRNSSDAILDRF